jgi:hypothetical protein
MNAPEYIPDYAFDCHTRKGKARSHESAVLLRRARRPPAVPAGTL